MVSANKVTLNINKILLVGPNLGLGSGNTVMLDGVAFLWKAHAPRLRVLLDLMWLLDVQVAAVARSQFYQLTS